MKIARREILMAIKTEKLMAENFIEYRYDYDLDKKVCDAKCRVCAVGAVLRYKGVKNHRIDGVAYRLTRRNVGVYGDLGAALKDREYLSALSIKFEILAEKYGAGKRTKEKLADFVKANFPKTIQVKDKV